MVVEQVHSFARLEAEHKPLSLMPDVEPLTALPIRRDEQHSWVVEQWWHARYGNRPQSILLSKKPGPCWGPE